MTAVAAKLDDLGKPAWIAADDPGVHCLVAARSRDPGLLDMERTNGMRKFPSASTGARRQPVHGTPWQSVSGNRAFDDYRTETLRRLEEEQREFREFLDRLRMAKDKAEFDQFMADRRNRPADAPAATARLRPR